MAIEDVDVPMSPGWWLKRQFSLLADRRRHQRLQLLHNYRSGNAPLPEGADNAREAFEAFQRKARTNMAELVVSAVSERITPTGFRTAVDDDETGDAEVGDLWERAGMDVRAANVHDTMLALSEAYAIVGPVDEDTGAPRVTNEDPRWCIGEPDPEDDRRLLAGLKVLYDDVEREDRAYLFLPGKRTGSGRTEVWVAARKTSTYSPSTIVPFGDARRAPTVDFDARGWDWVPERSGMLPHAMMPMIRFDNKDCLGEYETHTDLIDRINHQILMRLVIAVLQAHRQKAAKGMPQVYPPGHPKAGQEIDYSNTFTSDPAAFWMLPKDTELWESTPTDLRPILDAVKDDIQQLAAVTKTPVHVMMPSGVNQSAEGATLLREGLVYKVKDRISRVRPQWARLMSVMLVHAGMSDRADLAKLRVMFESPLGLSLAERADAAAKAKEDLPRRSRLIHIWGFSPSEADRIMSEWEYDQLLAAQTAAALAQELQAGQPGLNQPRQPLPGEQVPGGEQAGGPPTVGSQPTTAPTE